jgi:O-antigen ligase
MWQLLTGELLLGGNGRLIEFLGIALRSWIFLIVVSWWVWSEYRSGRLPMRLALPPWLVLPGALLSASVMAGAIIGLIRGNPPAFVRADIIPFLFFFLYFPARQFLSDPSRFSFHRTLIRLFLLGTALVSAGTLIAFSSGASVLHGPYYKWFRDVWGGKITDVGNHFFRVVSPDHLLLAPILIIIAAHLMKNPKQKHLWFWFAVGAIPFMADLSRIYLAAFCIGLCSLFSAQAWKRWFAVSCGTVLLLLSVFSTMHFAASRGASFGFDLLGPRLSSIVRPDTELSAATRKTLLPAIAASIRAHPFLGNGLGSSVVFTDPATQQLRRTTQFDWGYLEIWSELGLLGLAAYGILIFRLLRRLSARTDIRASVIAISVITVTAPALFHIFGIVFLVYAITQTDDASSQSRGGHPQTV